MVGQPLKMPSIRRSATQPSVCQKILACSIVIMILEACIMPCACGKLGLAG